MLKSLYLENDHPKTLPSELLKNKKSYLYFGNNQIEKVPKKELDHLKYLDLKKTTK
jgi:Leucine-rich repeat (LRR) protein